MATSTPLQSYTLASAQSSFTFNNIDQSYTDLTLIISGQVTTSAQNTYMRFNGDTGTNYSGVYLTGNGSAASCNRYTSASAITLDYNGSLGTTDFNSNTVHIPNYASNAYNKVVLSKAARGSNGVDRMTHLWRGSSAAITSITLYPGANSFAIGTTFSLYGVRAGGTAKASGGDIVVSDGTYWYHAFLKTGKFIPALSNLSCDVLVVAGGGAGGGYDAGGAGAGGLIGLSSTVLPSVEQVVLVGAGGAAANYGVSYNGSNSALGAYTAIGGGASGTGGGAFATLAQNGGSGGGGSSSLNHQSAGSGTPGQGNSGGAGTSAGQGGGGGAGGAGGPATSGAAGNGGTGATYNSTVGGTAGPFSFIDAIGAATGFGQSSGGHYYFAGGGGGSGASGTGGNATTGTGGLGGGGAGGVVNSGTGATITNATPGTANTGGGGGGGNVGAANGYGATGGSGIVIVRYAV